MPSASFTDPAAALPGDGRVGSPVGFEAREKGRRMRE
jgi:hypothetical protein